MKKIILALGLIFCFSLTGKSQWTAISSGTTAKLDAIYFIDSQIGYCSGAFLNTLETVDGGESWTMGSSQGFRDMDFFDDTYGYGASTVTQSMAKTTDGGMNWTSITPPTSNSLWAVSATSATTAYFVGTGGVIWKTINSGATVTVGNSGTTQLITDIVFTNPTTGFLVVQNGQIKKTTNSGLSWSIVESPGVSLTEMCFVDDNIGYVVGASGTVVKTTDAGLTWNTLTTNSTSNLQGVNFYDQNSGIAVGFEGTILYTNDGGITWDSQNSGTTEILWDVRMLSPTAAVVTGNNGTILKNNNLTTGVDEKLASFDVKFYPNPTSGQLKIESGQLSITEINIIDINGKTVKTLVTDLSIIDISNLPAGTYFLQLITDKGLYSEKFIKQ